MTSTIIAYEGPAGTSHQRAIGLLKTVELAQELPMDSTEDVLYTVDRTPGLLGIVPVETSTEGELTTTLDRMIFDTSDLYVREEVVLIEGIDVCSVGELSKVDSVISHPLIINLCRRYILEHGFNIRNAVSTAAACQTVAAERNPSLVALAPELVGHRAGLRITRHSVTDVPDIRTRYFLVGQEIAARTGADRSSVIVLPSKDEAGTLSHVSNCFATHRVNMVSILSRPLNRQLGGHAFYITLDGHIADESVHSAFEELLEIGTTLKLLGSYPKWADEEVTAPFVSAPLQAVDAKSDVTLLARLFDPQVARPL